MSNQGEWGCRNHKLQCSIEEEVSEKGKFTMGLQLWVTLKKWRQEKSSLHQSYGKLAEQMQQKGFIKALEIALHDTARMDTCHSTFVKTQKACNTK